MIDKPVENVRTDTRPHPAGGKGAKLSLKEVAERAFKGRMSPRLRAWVTQVLDKAGASRKGHREKAQAILDAFRQKVPYIADPMMGEFMATPEQTLCLDEGGLCIIGGDCFPERTLLLRDDFEFVPIEKIKVGERIWGKDRWSTITQKWAKGKLDVDAIDLTTGSTVYLTKNHKVYVGQCKHGGRCDQVQCQPAYKRLESFDRILVEELREGDVLLQPKRIATSMEHGGAGKFPLWRIGQREKLGTSAAVKAIERSVGRVSCWDISTDDRYVYLPEHDVTVSNCDDMSITLAAAMMSIGIAAMIIGSSHHEPYDVPSHVFIAFEDELGDWVKMDGTTKLPIGRVPPHAREWWVEPGQEAKERGEGDFVGMSGAPDQTGLARAPTLLDLLYPSIK